MAFYENKREHYGGALVLFQRNLAIAVPNSKSHRQQSWYMRLKIGGRKGYQPNPTDGATGLGRTRRTYRMESAASPYAPDVGFPPVVVVGLATPVTTIRQALTAAGLGSLDLAPRGVLAVPLYAFDSATRSRVAPELPVL